MGLLDRWTKKEEKKARTAKPVKVQKEKVKEAVVEAEVKTERAEQKAGLLAEKIIIKPLVTEKTAVMESLNKYGFIVSRKATKEQVKRAVDELYGVKPVAVNMINVQGKNGRKPGDAFYLRR